MQKDNHHQQNSRPGHCSQCSPNTIQERLPEKHSATWLHLVFYISMHHFLVSSEFLHDLTLHLSINDRMNFTNRTTRMARVILATRKMRTIRILVLTFFVAFWSCHFQVRLWSRIFSQPLDQHSATQSHAKPKSLKDKPLAPLSAKRSQAQTPKGLKQPPQSGRCYCRFDQFNSCFIQIC